ncbi:MAG TPA: amino acid racemase [Candidatus Acidoferrales bacterium]|nr:amino acid racemase [Candidatus Acidoferrales bacterium]
MTIGRYIPDQAAQPAILGEQYGTTQMGADSATGTFAGRRAPLTTEPKWKRRIGILGGLGPFAHLEFEHLLLQAASHRFGREILDQEYPAWILVSLPQIPDRTAALLANGSSPVPLLLEGFRLLRESDFCVITCNTAHIFIDEIRKQINQPILDIVSETIRHVTSFSHGNSPIGLIGTTATLRLGLYQRRSKILKSTIQFVTPLDFSEEGKTGEIIQKQHVMDLIYGSQDDAEDPLKGGIKAGAHRHRMIHDEMQRRFRKLLKWFEDAGINTVVLACTELALICGRRELGSVSLIDPLEIAASAAIEIAAGERPLP